jgi:hypothetical protein
MRMFRSHNILRLLCTAAAVAFGTAELAAEPANPAAPGMKNGGKTKGQKASDPLDGAIKDLQEAEKVLDAKDGSAAKHAKSAAKIVGDQDTSTKQARDRAAENSNVPKEDRERLKARVTALNSILKDIRTAEKEIAAHKTDAAKTAIQSAITGLGGLTGTVRKKK